MILVHGVYHDGGLVLWAETSEAAGAMSAERPEAEAHRAHPFAAAAPVLAGVLKSADPDSRVTARRVRPAAMWLPSRPDAPAASSSLIASTDGPDAGPTHISPWIVPALRLEPTESIALLRAVSRDRSLAAGVFVGTDLRFWAEDAFRFAAALVVRQRFLPGIVIDPRGARAVWDPVCTGDDGERLMTIAARMPGSARAATALDAEAAPDHPPVDVLRRCVAMLLDQLVRSTITTTVRVANRDSPNSHNLWLDALLAADGRLDRSVDAGHMTTQIAGWRRPVATAERSPFRLCFRLEEPDAAPGADSAPDDASAPDADSAPDDASAPDADSAPDDAWYVRYLLQPYADPSLLVSSADGWDEGVGHALAPALRMSGARESLLLGLGQAAGISTRVARSLENVRPDGFSLGTQEAYDFLSEEALALEEAGFGVLLPSWWARKGTGLRLSARARVQLARIAVGQRNRVAGHDRPMSTGTWRLAINASRWMKSRPWPR